MSDGTLTASHPPARPPLLRLLSDARLARLAAQGSTAAFSTIYERHHQELYRYCRSLLRNEHDARDALQSTMLNALRGLQGETREIALRPWLFRIAHNESISLLRRRPTDSSIDTAAELTTTDTDPETRERLRNLIADLEQLAPRQRSALVMRELSGLEFSDIAAALETSPAAAKQAVYEARTALHELEEGRDLSCDEVRRKISAEDRRLLRGRRVRGHLKACADCRRFSELTRKRSGQLAAIAPPLPLPIAMGILQGILGGGGGGGGIAAMLGGGGGAGLGGATAAKLGVAGVLVLGAGAVAIEQGSGDPASRASPVPERSGQAADSDIVRAAPASAAGAETQGARGGDNGGVKGGGNSGGEDDSAASGAFGGGGSDDAPEAAANTKSSSGNGPASTPPGHGGTPPGQGGNPPGLGAPPPGHGGAPPGQSNNAPGHVATPPGLDGSLPPGQGGIPPGQANNPIVGTGGK